MKTNLFLCLLALSPFAAHADGYNWKGSCQNPSDGISVQIEPWDDDVKITVKQGRTLLFNGIASSDIIAEDAHAVTFTGQDERRHASLTMTIIRKQGLEPEASRLRLNEQTTMALDNCTLNLAQEN